MSQSSTGGPEDGEPRAEPPAPGGGAPLGLLGDPWFRFAATFGALAIGCEMLYYLVLVDTPVLKDYLRLLATVAGTTLELLGRPVEITGTTVRYSGFSVQIAHGCDAIQICALLTCAMISFPAPWKARFWGLALGILWLQFLNQLRIISLLIIGADHPSQFATAHLSVWPTVLIILTVLTWIAWVRLASLDEPEPSPPEA